jgi:hypothetical protein
MSGPRVIVLGPEDDDDDSELELKEEEKEEVVPAGPRMKTSLRVQRRVESLYTGGKVAISHSSFEEIRKQMTTKKQNKIKVEEADPSAQEDERDDQPILLCSCNEGVNIVRLSNGQVIGNIRSVSLLLLLLLLFPLPFSSLSFFSSCLLSFSHSLLDSGRTLVRSPPFRSIPRTVMLSLVPQVNYFKYGIFTLSSNTLLPLPPPLHSILSQRLCLLPPMQEMSLLLPPLRQTLLLCLKEDSNLQ